MLFTLAVQNLVKPLMNLLIISKVLQIISLQPWKFSHIRSEQFWKQDLYHIFLSNIFSKIHLFYSPAPWLEIAKKFECDMYQNAMPVIKKKDKKAGISNLSKAHTYSSSTLASSTSSLTVAPSIGQKTASNSLILSAKPTK